MAKKTVVRKPKPRASAPGPALQFDPDAQYVVHCKSGAKQFIRGRELAARWGADGAGAGYSSYAARIVDAAGQVIFSAEC